MPNLTKNSHFTALLVVSLLSLTACSAKNSLHPYAKTNHFSQKTPMKINHKPQKHATRYAKTQRPKPAKIKKYANLNDRLRGRRTLDYQHPTRSPSPEDMFQRWVEYEPHYTLYPGDQIEVVVQSAPELSRTLTVGPDGRITMPMVAPFMASGRTVPYVQKAIKAELAKQLRDPTLTVTNRAFAPQQIYVGGQVARQGTYAMSGPIGSLEAVIMAGGFLPSAKSKNVAVMRRAPNGAWMMRVVNHKDGMNNIISYADNMQLRRGDVIFIPRNTLSEIGTFMQAFRQALPVEIGLSYNIGNGFSGN
ncbi:MAG: polysaccharide export protein [Robiginitomaculum sp.]|nr:MAG: polysaccharide export protein [Robiginitomaculum sp.]